MAERTFLISSLCFRSLPNFNFFFSVYGEGCFDKFCGKMVCMKFTEVCEGKLAVHVQCMEEGYSDFKVFCCGVEQCMKNEFESYKATMTKVSDCCLKVCLCSEKCGKMEVELKFSDDGLCRVSDFIFFYYTNLLFSLFQFLVNFVFAQFVFNLDLKLN